MKATMGSNNRSQNFASSGWLMRRNACQKFFRHPRGERTGEQQTAGNILPHRSPIHDEVVLMAVIPLFREDALPERALRHGHVHFGVTFHAPFNPLVGSASASLKSFPEGKILNSAAMSTTIKGPPVNSAKANCQPISTIKITLSSITDS